MEEEIEKGRNRKIRKVHRKTVEEWMLKKVMVLETFIERKEKERERCDRGGKGFKEDYF